MRRSWLWAAAIVLSALGVVAATGRAIFVADLAQRVDPVRDGFFRAVGKHEPFPVAHHTAIRDFDRPFAKHRVAAWLHVIPGGLFLALAPLQFSRRFRARYLRVHRGAGRLLVLCGVLASIPAFYFGLAMPFAGFPEAVAIGLFGALFCLSLVRGFVAIRRREVAQHREWMIRAYAIAVAISTIRLINLALDVALAPGTFAPRQALIVSLWTGWVLMIAVAELWVRTTRTAAVNL